MRFFISIFCIFSALFAEPPTVIHGEAQIIQKNKLTEITVADHTILQWENFFISSDETIKINQSSPSDWLLIRIAGHSKSKLKGTLLADGQIIFLNENGITIEKNASINTAALVASTQDLLDEKFLNNNLSFEGTSDASITNLGTIQTNANDALLLARHIKNRGRVIVTHGNALFSCGYGVLYEPASPHPISLLYSALIFSSSIENAGTIKTNDQGSVFISSFDAAVINSGTISAGKIAIEAHSVKNTGLFDAPVVSVETNP